MSLVGLKKIKDVVKLAERLDNFKNLCFNVYDDGIVVDGYKIIPEEGKYRIEDYKNI